MNGSSSDIGNIEIINFWIVKPFSYVQITTKISIHKDDVSLL